jgi:hypothetical protein
MQFFNEFLDVCFEKVACFIIICVNSLCSNEVHVGCDVMYIITVFASHTGYLRNKSQEEAQCLFHFLSQRNSWPLIVS